MPSRTRSAALAAPSSAHVTLPHDAREQPSDGGVQEGATIEEARQRVDSREPSRLFDQSRGPKRATELAGADLQQLFVLVRERTSGCERDGTQTRRPKRDRTHQRRRALEVGRGVLVLDEREPSAGLHPERLDRLGQGAVHVPGLGMHRTAQKRLR